MHVFKFGGASVKDADSVRNILSILKKFRNEPLAVVISAMGKTTNHLEEVVSAARKGKSYAGNFNELARFHREVAEQLLGRKSEKGEQLLKELQANIHSIREWSPQEAYDQIVSFGELLSTAIIHEYLADEIEMDWIDARKIIRTDQFFSEANIDWVITNELVRQALTPVLESGRSVVTQGFIGSAPNGMTTTLGREGSDFSAAILAHCLNAQDMTVWKDVPGILNADPKLMEDAEQFDHISYREATEMTYYGAKVIHPKTLKPLAQKNIPLLVRSFIVADAPGTRITREASTQQIPTFVFQQNQLLVTAEVKDHSFMDEKKLGTILQTLDLLNVKINLMQVSALTFSFSMDYKPYKLERIQEFLSRDFLLSEEYPLKLATIKNATPESMSKLPNRIEKILEQRTVANYQVLYR